MASRIAQYNSQELLYIMHACPFHLQQVKIPRTSVTPTHTSKAQPGIYAMPNFYGNAYQSLYIVPVCYQGKDCYMKMPRQMTWLFTAANLAWSIVALLLRLCATAAAAVGSGGKAAGSSANPVLPESSSAVTRETTLLPTSPVVNRESSDFSKFIQSIVIPGFFRQRDKGHSEFAVLLLPKAETLSDIGQVDLLPRKPLVKRKQPFYPTVSQGHVNYMVARPDQANHCEATLLRHLPALWSSCKRKGAYTPTHIILYTWIQPCAGCTSAIIQTLSGYPASTLAPAKVVVVYTVRWKRISEEENEYNKKRLVDSGISVIRVKFSIDL